MLEGFINESKNREIQKIQNETSRIWKTWSEGKEITEEIESVMNPIISALDKVNPEWDDNKILDEAYRRAKIIIDPDGNVKSIASNVLKDAEAARKQNPPKITPKQPEKALSDMKYSELLARG